MKRFIFMLCLLSGLFYKAQATLEKSLELDQEEQSPSLSSEFLREDIQDAKKYIYNFLTYKDFKSLVSVSSCAYKSVMLYFKNNLRENINIKSYFDKLNSVFDQEFEEVLKKGELWEPAKYSRTIEFEFKDWIFKETLKKSSECSLKYFDQFMYTYSCFHRDEDLKANGEVPNYLKDYLYTLYTSHFSSDILKSQCYLEKEIESKNSNLDLFKTIKTYSEMEKIFLHQSWSSKLNLFTPGFLLREDSESNLSLKYNVILMIYYQNSYSIKKIINKFERKIDRYTFLPAKTAFGKQLNTFIETYNAWYPLDSQKKNPLSKLCQFQNSLNKSHS